MIQTEFSFKLPKGYLDHEGVLHQEGVMRLATASDEIAPLKDARVIKNQAYLSVILLSRVITQLGELKSINPKVIEELFVEDLKFLEEMYNQINGYEKTVIATCPKCKTNFEVKEQISGE